MPGSPPPVTRSSSAIPDESRGASWLLPDSVSSANCRPLRFDRIETGTAVAPSSSESVFHSPQASHLPCQREYAAPQFWQTKESEDLAICDSPASVISARARGCQDISLSMTWKHTLSFPRRVIARVLQSRCPLRSEGAGKAGRRLRPQHRVQ